MLACKNGNVEEPQLPRHFPLKKIFTSQKVEKPLVFMIGKFKNIFLKCSLKKKFWKS
jgi:hypothetical protein